MAVHKRRWQSYKYKYTRVAIVEPLHKAIRLLKKATKSYTTAQVLTPAIRDYAISNADRIPAKYLDEIVDCIELADEYVEVTIAEAKERNAKAYENGLKKVNEAKKQIANSKAKMELDMDYKYKPLTVNKYNADGSIRRD